MLEEHHFLGAKNSESVICHLPLLREPIVFGPIILFQGHQEKNTVELDVESTVELDVKPKLS